MLSIELSVINFSFSVTQKVHYTAIGFLCFNFFLGAEFFIDINQLWYRNAPPLAINLTNQLIDNILVRRRTRVIVRIIIANIEAATLYGLIVLLKNRFCGSFQLVNFNIDSVVLQDDCIETEFNFSIIKIHSQLSSGAHFLIRVDVSIKS